VKPSSVGFTGINWAYAQLSAHEALIPVTFLALGYQVKDIVVFRFIIEYSSSLRDFYRPLGNK
jgi:urate oxidase